MEMVFFQQKENKKDKCFYDLHGSSNVERLKNEPYRTLTYEYFLKEQDMGSPKLVVKNNQNNGRTRKKKIHRGR